MNLILTLFSLFFSFFFIILSYWKEDRNFNIIGSISLMITFALIIGTGVQISELTLANYYTNTTNYTVNTYLPQTFTYGATFYENIGVGVFMFIFTAIQYLYFSMSHKIAKEDAQ